MNQLVQGLAATAEELGGGGWESPPPPTVTSGGLVSIKQAALHFNVSPHTVRRRVLSREWPHVRVGRQIRIDLDRILSKRRA
jgi:excisionase family DNA binding protein